MAKTKNKKDLSPIIIDYAISLWTTIGIQFFLPTLAGISFYLTCVGVSGGNIKQITTCPVTSFLDILVVISPLIGALIFLAIRRKPKEIIVFLLLILILDFILLHFAYHETFQDVYNNFFLELFKVKHFDPFT
ncbi:MAG TPA: hypothetical protein VHE53_01675 [Patescibacteria group bacterium]|nr:hypothetical protein [Patescibacteria group bacterium]